ncbi:MAG TPA: ABC transporter substrate-binding protein [Stellaceae bacterium]|jgi:ABC-type nitrate/sulfonate/bicarbonate transport system substrate-binding protein
MKHWIIAAIALLALAAPARAEEDHALLALPTEGMQFMAYYIADDLGIFAAEQLEVKHQVMAGVASFNAVVSGSAEFAFASGASITRAAAHGQKMLAIAQMNNVPSWDIVIRKDVADAAHFDPSASLAERAKVLQGHIIGTQGINALDHAYLRVVAKIGGDPDNMTVSAMAPVDTLAAFARRAIDGFVSAPPWPQQVEEDGSAVPVASGPKGEPSSLVPIASGLVVTRPQLCAEHRSLCEKMGHAMLLAARAAHERPKDVLVMLAKRFPSIKPSVLERSQQLLIAGTPIMPAVDPNAIRKGDQLNVDAGFMKASDMLPSYDGLSTNEYLK